MGVTQNPTEQLNGIDSRGDAALRQAIATGSPVPTNGKQAGELPRIDEWFPVGGDIVVSDKQGCICFLTDEDGNRVVIDADTPDAEVMRLDANSRMICAAPSLAAENARLRAALQEVVTAITNEIASDKEPCWSAVFDDVLVIASAELRGGAK
jgi:hypothetical protein